MKKLAYQTYKNVYFTAFKINESTNKMFDVMEKSFGSNFLQVNEMENPEKFTDTMTLTMT